VTRDDEPRRDLRDLMAAAALTGLLASVTPGAGQDCGMGPTEFRATLARGAYLMADAMLAARGGAK
jgi:hypothetical protein